MSSGPVGGVEDFASLGEAAESLDECAEELSGQVEELQGTVTSDSPWGQDEPGTMFGAVYTEVLSQALESIGSHVALLAEGAQRLQAWEESSRENEAANADDADAIGSDVLEV